MKLVTNKKYTTISFYVIIVFFICMIIYKMVMSWTDSMVFLSSIIRVLSPFLLAMLISYFMNPLVANIEKRIIPKIFVKNFKIKTRKNRLALAIFLSYLIFTTVTIVLLAIIIPQITDSIVDFSNNLPTYVENLTEQLATVTFEFAGSNYYLDTKIVSTYLSNSLPATIDQAISLIPNLLDLVKNFASGLMNVLIAYIVSIYLISSKEKASKATKKIVIALFSPKAAKNIFDITTHAHKVFSSFFIGKLIDSFIIGLLCFIVLMIFNFPFALLISVIVGITNIIPYFGPLIGGGIGFVFLLLISPAQAFGFFIIVLILQQFDGNILGPWILGDSVGLSPFWVIFAIIVFGSMFGLVGMFLGAPLLSVIKYIISKPIESMYNRKTQLAIEQIDHANPID